MGKPLINEVGNTYSYLTVLERAENTNDGRARWLCECKCGNKVIVYGKHLRSGNTKSCGCLQKELLKEKHKSKHKDIIGQTYGYLKVIDYGDYAIRPDGKKDQRMLCECQLCNSLINVRTYDLKLGNQTSCGCSNSRGNTKINTILSEKKIIFQREYKIDNCKDKRPLPFDFAILNNDNQLQCLIEYQGIQHFTCENHGWDNPEKFQNVQLHDRIKKDFCEENGIKLYYITYQENIEERLEEIFSELYC